MRLNGTDIILSYKEFGSISYELVDKIIFPYLFLIGIFIFLFGFLLGIAIIHLDNEQKQKNQIKREYEKSLNDKDYRKYKEMRL